MAKLVRWLAAAVLALIVAAPAAMAQPAHGIAMHGEPAYPPDFTHFSYVNPAAPKGGSLVMAAIGSFDNLNPYIVRGSAASGVGLTFETLTTQSNDEAFTEYGLLAKTMRCRRIAPGSPSSCARRRAGTMASRSPSTT